MQATPTVKAVTGGVFWVLKQNVKIKCKNNHAEFNKQLHGKHTEHSPITTFASIFRFYLTEIGRHLQPSDTFIGL